MFRVANFCWGGEYIIKLWFYVDHDIIYSSVCSAYCERDRASVPSEGDEERR